MPSVATIHAGIPATNMTLYRGVRFKVGDPAALAVLPDGKRLFLVRDIEMDRARRHARADEVACPADFTPEGGLSGDRETATAQALAECLRRRGIAEARADRTLPLIFAEHLRLAGIAVRYDAELGVAERRAKDAQELDWLRAAQAVTEEAMRLACETVARATAGRDGTLAVDGMPLTSESLRARIDVFLLSRGFENPESIVAGGPQGSDCHDHGHGALRTGEPVIVDIFPRDRKTLYCGDCTRTVVHGEIPDTVRAIHAAVVAAKRDAIAAIRPGVTGEAVNAATLAALAKSGFAFGPPALPGVATISHGTGHGIGLEVHEPPLLAPKGPPLVAGDVVTVEPGLYAIGIGGVRVEDMVAVTATGHENFNRLPEGLDWR